MIAAGMTTTAAGMIAKTTSRGMGDHAHERRHSSTFSPASGYRATKYAKSRPLRDDALVDDFDHVGADLVEGGGEGVGGRPAQPEADGGVEGYRRDTYSPAEQE